MKLMRILVFAACAGGALATPASAQSVADFYKGKTVQMQIGFGPGASYDLYGRLVAEHIGRYIPGNPQVVSMNMEGAGSLRVVNWLYNVAPKDGTVLATASRAAPFAPLARRGRRHLVRGGEVHLDRQRQQRGVDLRRLGHDRRQIARSVAQHGIDHRRRRRGRRRRAVRAGDERSVRHQDQDRQRLSRRQRDQSRARARGGAAAAAAGHGRASRPSACTGSRSR